MKKILFLVLISFGVQAQPLTTLTVEKIMRDPEMDRGCAIECVME